MRYHVPFHQRQNASIQRPPVYIGFDVPARPRRRFSWMGFWGFFLCLFSCGILAPITLVMSLLGLRRGVNFFAVAGTLVSGLFVSGMVLSIIAGIAEERERHARHHRNVQQRVNSTKIDTTNSTLVAVEKEIRQFKTDNDGNLPSPMQGSMLAVEHEDAWGQELRYEPAEDGCLVRSAGIDQKFDTADDLLRHIQGELVDDHRIRLEDELFDETEAETESESRSDSYAEFGA